MVVSRCYKGLHYRQFILQRSVGQPGQKSQLWLEINKITLFLKITLPSKLHEISVAQSCKAEFAASKVNLYYRFSFFYLNRRSLLSCWIYLFILRTELSETRGHESSEMMIKIFPLTQQTNFLRIEQRAEAVFWPVFHQIHFELFTQISILSWKTMTGSNTGC